MKLVGPEFVLEYLQHTKDSILIDIREPYEIALLKIDCQNVPMGAFSQVYNAYSSYKQVILMCQSGKRAEALANFMETQYNVDNIYILEGGLNAWLESKCPPTLSL